jgi:ABC-type transport system involved in multi-copper enzyme maturation permease subunit
MQVTTRSAGWRVVRVAVVLTVAAAVGCGEPPPPPPPPQAAAPPPPKPISLDPIPEVVVRAGASGTARIEVNRAGHAGEATIALTPPSDPGLTVTAEPIAADLPEGRWKATLTRTFIPLVGVPESGEEITGRFGKIADGQLWTITEIRETGTEWARKIGSQTWEMAVAPGRDLRLLWPHRFTLFGDSIELAGTKGAPLGLEVLILQKLLATGLGGTILLLVSVAVTAAFVPNMVRKGTLELLLVRPIPRWQLLVFKYVGALLLVAGLLGILVLAVWLITGILADVWSPGVLLALPSLLVFFALLLSVSVLTGVITRSVISAMLVTVAYWAILFIAGQMNNVAVESRIREANVGKLRPTSIAETIRGRQPRREEGLKPGRKPFYQTTIGRITEGVYAVLPHTEDLDNLVDRQLMRDFAVAGPFRALMESASFSWEKGLGLTLLHTVAYLAIACTIFSRRDP